MTTRSTRILVMTAAFLAGLVLCFGVVLIVTGRLSSPVAQQIAAFSVRIEGTEWRVISARKADKLLRELLFERVYAIRQRSFAQTQVNMHFSLSQDLTALVEFLRLWRERGPQGLASMLERGLV